METLKSTFEIAFYVLKSAVFTIVSLVLLIVLPSFLILKFDQAFVNPIWPLSDYLIFRVMVEEGIVLGILIFAITKWQKKKKRTEEQT